MDARDFISQIRVVPVAVFSGVEEVRPKLGALSVMGALKFHTLAGLCVPLLALSVPLTDTVFAVLRRLAHGQSPFRADRGHIHHRLLDLGLSQRQAVALLCGLPSLQGLAAVLLAGTDALSRTLCLLPALAPAAALWIGLRRGGGR